MKKFFALPLAALFAAACSEPTAPATQLDLTPSYGKPVSGGSNAATGTFYTDSYDFNTSSVAVASHSGIGSDTNDGSVASSAGSIQYAPSNVSNGFIGRFNNTQTRALLVLTDAGSKYTVNFDVYTIGSWDGRGKQAQQGSFLANVFQVGYRCGSGSAAVTPIFTTTFSNQYTVQQDYPSSLYSGGNKAGTGSLAIDALGYKDRPDLSSTPTFRSFGDATYRMSYTISNVCGGVAPTFVFSSSAPGQQSNYDESWGLDNITLKVDH